MNADKCREKAAGRWDSVLETLAPQLIPALDHKGRRHVACPVHGGKDGFRVFKDVSERGASICNTCGRFSDGFATLMWANGWDFRTTLNEVSKYFGEGSSGQYLGAAMRRVPPPKPPAPKTNPETLRYVLNKVWCESVPITSRAAEPARLYLARRGLSIAPQKSLRFHPALMYVDENDNKSYHPGILALVQGADGSAVTLHRTYLTPEGAKADVEAPKRLMSYPEDRKILGGAIRLVPAGRVLGVAEGIETAHAVIEGTGLPTWPTVNAWMLAGFVPPVGVEQLIVFVDKDRPSPQHPLGHGQEAAKQLVQAAWKRGIKAMAITPAGEIPQGEKSLDWLDILRRDGAKGFPSLDSVRRAMLLAA